MTAREQRRAEREQRRAERRMERERQYGERRARMMEYAKMRQRPIEIQEQPSRPELAFEREEPRPNLFEGLFWAAGRHARRARESKAISRLRVRPSLRQAKRRSSPVFLVALDSSLRSQ